MSSAAPFTLASQSPRRREILERLGYSFLVTSSEFDERSVSEDLSATDYVAAVALGKAQAAAAKHPQSLLLASDLTVRVDSRLVHKPASVEEARTLVPQIWDRWHDECGACVVGRAADSWQVRVQTSRLWVPKLSAAQFEEYLAIADPTDKAGGICIRSFVQVAGPDSVQLDGFWSTILGLNVFDAAELLAECGQPAPISPSTVEQELARDILGA